MYYLNDPLKLEGCITVDLLGEFISEAYQLYKTSPQTLKKKDRELYDLIRRAE